MQMQLTDEMLRTPDGTDDDAIVAIDVKFEGNWDRVEQALTGLGHDAVRYRWSTDASGDVALYIEIPVTEDPSAEELLEFRGELRQSLNDADIDMPVYFHFVDAATPLEFADA